jgi:hypothetical protein
LKDKDDVLNAVQWQQICLSGNNRVRTVTYYHENVNCIAIFPSSRIFQGNFIGIYLTIISTTVRMAEQVSHCQKKNSLLLKFVKNHASGCLIHASVFKTIFPVAIFKSSVS